MKSILVEQEGLQGVPARAQIELGVMDQGEPVDISSPTVIKRLSDRGVIRQNIYGGWVWA